MSDARDPKSAQPAANQGFQHQAESVSWQAVAASLTLRASIAFRFVSYHVAESVFAVAAGCTVGAVFLYMFRGFLGSIVASSGSDVAMLARRLLTFAVVGAALGVTWRTYVQERDSDGSVRHLGNFLGTSAATMWLYSALWVFLTSVFFGTIGAWIVATWGDPASVVPGGALTLAALGSVAMIRKVRTRKLQIPERNLPISATRDQSLSLPAPIGLQVVLALAAWRMRQIMSRHWVVGILGLAVVAAILSAFAAAHRQEPAQVLAAYMSGYLLAIPLVAQIASEEGTLWLEESAGIPPGRIIRSHLVLGAGFAFAAVLLVTSTTAVGRLFASPSATSMVPIIAPDSHGPLVATLVAIAVSALAPFTAAPISLPLERRRAGLNGFLVFLVSFFLATGILAFPLAIVVAPVVWLALLQNVPGMWPRDSAASARGGI